jgi:leader peptidase (prepilin peptidase) / N-methyltransferase
VDPYVTAVAIARLLRPLTAAGVGGLWTASYLILGRQEVGRLGLGLALCVLLAAVTLTDLERRVIPNAFVLPAAVAGIAIVASTEPDLLPQNLVAAVIAGVGLLAVALVDPGGMGMGDVKLAATMGVYLGPAVALALLIGFVGAAGLGVALIARDGAAARKRGIPLAPFLAVGGVVTLWFGDGILSSYSRGVATGG